MRGVLWKEDYEDLRLLYKHLTLHLRNFHLTSTKKRKEERSFILTSDLVDKRKHIRKRKIKHKQTIPKAWNKCYKVLEKVQKKSRTWAMNSGFWTVSWSVQGVSQPAVAKQNTDRSQMWDTVCIQLPQGSSPLFKRFFFLSLPRQSCQFRGQGPQ